MNILADKFTTALLHFIVAAENQDVYIEEIVLREYKDAEVTPLGALYGIPIKMKTIVREQAPPVVKSQMCGCSSKGTKLQSCR